MANIAEIHNIDSVFSGLTLGVVGTHPGFCLYTSESHQFVAYYDSDRNMRVAARELTSDDWTRVALPTRLEWDSHNYVTLTLDAGGHIHIAGNMHNSPLCYFRSRVPRDITTLEQISAMTGKNEDRVTYPKFLHDAKGSLIFTYRDGSSGAGNEIYNIYNHKECTWQRLHDTPLTDGQGLMNAYFHGPVRGPDGFFHLCWVWRDSPDAITTHSLCYAKSVDLRTWETSSGEVLQLPITLKSAEIVDPVGRGGGMINNNHVIGFDSEGRVVISFQKFDEAGNTQIYQARREMSGWAIYQTTKWDYRWDVEGGGTIPFDLQFAPVRINREGELSQSYWHVKYGAGTFVINESAFDISAQTKDGLVPHEFAVPESKFPGMQVNWARDQGESTRPDCIYALRWESLPENRDQPLGATLPPSTPLQLFRISASNFDPLPCRATDPISAPQTSTIRDASYAGNVRNLVSIVRAEEVRAEALTKKYKAQRLRTEALTKKYKAQRLRTEVLTKKYKAQRLRTEVLTKKYKAQRLRTEVLTKEYKAQRSQTLKVNVEVQNLTAELQKAQAQTVDLEARAAKLTAELQAKKSENTKLDTKVKALQRELKTIKGSYSWRLTSPLRLAVRRLRLVGHTTIRGAKKLSEPRLTAARPQVSQGVVKATSTASLNSWWARFALEQFKAERPVDFHAILERLKRNTIAPAVVVPVYNAARELDECLQSLLRHTESGSSIIVIDDASPDPAVQEVLERYRQYESVQIHKNEANLGFSGTVNRGIQLAGRADVILLNSDTIVPPGWLRNLQIAAYSASKVGTATPLSNNAGAFSAPDIGKNNEIPADLALHDYCRAIAQASLRSYPVTPTGHGFCMYVRRDCLDEIGLLDAQAFPKGYGEENDFCMRAGRAGWTHVVDDSTLIYHVRAASFGEAKAELMKHGRRIIDERYPEYTSAVRELNASARMQDCRNRVRDIASAASQKACVKPRVLYVLSTNTGGTPNTNQDLMKALRGEIEAFVLRCDSSTISLMYFHDGAYIELGAHSLATPLKAFPHRSEEYDAVVFEWLVRFNIELVHVRHIAWHSLGLIEVAKLNQVPVVFSFHDFYVACPTVKLLDENYIYCGGTCTTSTGQCAHELWREPDFPPLKHNAIHQWHEQMEMVLERCDAFVTTVESAKAVILRTYPRLTNRRFVVIPHGRDFETFKREAPPRLLENERLRILIPGNINEAKGGLVIKELSEVAKANRLELHIVGNVPGPLKALYEQNANVFLHGPYRREQFVEKVEQIRPHIGAVFSIWPETYCHTLTELWASGLPVIGFDYGAVRDRIRDSGAGWLTSAPTLSGILDIVRLIRDEPDEYHSKVNAVRAWQDGVAPMHDCRRMGERYLEIYRSLWIKRQVHGPMDKTGVAATSQIKSILVTTPTGRHGNREGTAFIRVLRPLQHYSLSNVLAPRLVTSDWNGDHPADAWIIQRDAIREESQAERLLEHCQEKRIRLIYEIDDDLFHIESPHPSAARFNDAVKAAMRLVAENAAIVIVSTDTLRLAMLPFNRSVVVMPNALDEQLWQCSDLPNAEAGKKDRVAILYMGTATHGDDLAILEAPIKELKKKFGRLVTFKCIGGFQQAPDWVEIEKVPNAARSYPEFARWMSAQAHNYHIAVAPLMDSAFNRHKSYIKYLDYGICGFASVFSDIGPYRDIVQHGKTGLLVPNTTEHWIDALSALVADAGRREHLAVCARKHVLDGHTLAAQSTWRKKAWQEILG